MGGRPTWRRIALPGAGGVGDQDHRLLTALELLKDVHNALLRPRPRPEPTD